MAFSDMNDVEQELGEEKPPEDSSNRTFLIVAGILGGIMVLALLCMVGYVVIKNLSGQRSAANVNATRAAQATAIAFASTQTASAPTATSTRRPTAIPATPIPTNTPVIVTGPTNTPTMDVAEATRSALLTQVAQAELTPIQPTSTLLPGTGLADEVGTPGLLAIAFVLVVIIFLVRRLRSAS
jgi:hypothetical protein